MIKSRIDVEAVFRTHPFAAEIVRQLSDAGHETYLIGGVVRDGLQAAWGRVIPFPPDDIDIATAATPEEVRSVFAGRTIIDVGEAFGVLVLVGPGGRSYEVATFRAESDYDGRKPGRVDLVRTLEGDVLRRDLTVNGLAAGADGVVIDLVGGVRDLEERRIAAIGDPKDRFAEDHLRLLRAVRFTCQIDGTLDPETEGAIVSAAPSIAVISKERVRDEILRLLSTSRGAMGVEWLDRLGLLQVILPELAATKGVPQPEEYHPEGDVFTHTVLALRRADRFVRDPIIKLAVLLHDIGKPRAFELRRGENMGGHCAIGAEMTRRIGERLRMSREDVARLSFLVKNHMRIAALPDMGRGKQVRFVSTGEVPDAPSLSARYPAFMDLLRVLVADCEASAHRSSGWGPILRETLGIADHIERVCGMKRARELIDGDVLIRLGQPAGPKLGEILGGLHDRILAGEIRSAEEAEAAAKSAIDRQPTGKKDSA